ncbi:MAG: hypothetical protein N2746_06435 [Deltaproteobacteria bacterium]|nr:hypothetical protein [Deltaproteobacteria bacterium]
MKIILILIFSFFYPNNTHSETIKNLIAFLGFSADKKPLIIIIETTRRSLSIKNKTENYINVKYLMDYKIQNLHEDRFISNSPIEKFGFSKNILIKILEQNQIEIGTAGLNYNFNIISLAPKKRATYTKSVNNIDFKYYINTAFLGKEGTPQKGSILFFEARGSTEDFHIPDVLFMTDNLYKSWFISQISKNVSAIVFSDAADFFKTATSYRETNRSLSIDMEKGITYNRSALFFIPELKHTLEVNSTSELEEYSTNMSSNNKIYIFSEGYAKTKDGLTSIFGIRILNKKK